MNFLIKNKNFIITLIFSFGFSDIIHVPEEYSTIQEAIDASVDGDTVLVANGEYVENLVINKSIVLASHAINDDLEDWLLNENNEWFVVNSNIQNTRLIGSNPDDPDYGSVILITPNSNECISPEIVGFTIEGGSGTNVLQINESGETVLVRLGGGILADVSDPYIHHNQFTDNGSDNLFAGGGSQLTSNEEDWSFNARFPNYSPRCDIDEFQISNNFYDNN
tara:strand:- start:137 stop:802 length:666 start_codon:yes stop_codon:yes gene_type:complete